MVVAVQHPIAECTAIFSVGIANHRPLLVQDMLTSIIGLGNHKYLGSMLCILQQLYGINALAADWDTELVSVLSLRDITTANHAH